MKPSQNFAAGVVVVERLTLRGEKRKLLWFAIQNCGLEVIAVFRDKYVQNESTTILLRE